MSSNDESKTNNLTELLPYWDRLVRTYNYALYHSVSHYEVELMQTILYPVLEDIKNNGIDYYTKEELYKEIYNSYAIYYNNSIKEKTLVNVNNMIILRDSYCNAISKLDDEVGDFIFEYVPEITQNIE